ncbi:hypothetical protein HELRODRAFT_70118, partial [Helobdella robusta]|uniref:Integrase catalytic domain-containing protein n=1 Tax=Helobdella robusta TaxID=6412 RepID=T1G029_HELRO
PVVIPFKNTLTETILDKLFINWILLYGVPETITTERGRQFISFAFKRFIYTY